MEAQRGEFVFVRRSLYERLLNLADNRIPVWLALQRILEKYLDTEYFAIGREAGEKQKMTNYMIFEDEEAWTLFRFHGNTWGYQQFGDFDDLLKRIREEHVEEAGEEKK
jgi:hypothetical protein